jgi:hypothetical protein
MTVPFNKVVDGIVKYIDNEIYSGMNDLQEMAVRIVVGRVAHNRERLKEILEGNPIVKSLAIIDSDGNVDADTLLSEIKAQIDKKGSFKVEIPWFGKMTFVPEDVDKLRREIFGEL